MLVADQLSNRSRVFAGIGFSYAKHNKFLLALGVFSSVLESPEYGLDCVKEYPFVLNSSGASHVRLDNNFSFKKVEFSPSSDAYLVNRVRLIRWMIFVYTHYEEENVSPQ